MTPAGGEPAPGRPGPRGVERSRLALLAGVAALAVSRTLRLDAAGAAGPPWTVTVYKSPTCGCCTEWVAHLRDRGFRVRAEDVAELQPIKARHGVPAALQSCHTALVGGYVLEGHVPADLIQRLLRERPPVVGLAVPGMPVGSPGMGVPGARADRYDVVTFDRRGVTGVFATR